MRTRLAFFAANLLLGNLILHFAKQGERGGMLLAHLVFSVSALALLELALRAAGRWPRRWLLIALPLALSLVVPSVAVTLWMALKLALDGSLPPEGLAKALLFGLLAPMAGWPLCLPMAGLNLGLFHWGFRASGRKP